MIWVEKHGSYCGEPTDFLICPACDTCYRKDPTTGLARINHSLSSRCMCGTNKQDAPIVKIDRTIAFWRNRS